MAANLIPITRMAVTDIRDTNQPGLFFPVGASEPTLLLTGEAGHRHAIKLSGSDRFNQFEIKLATPCAGLFVPDVEIRVDIESRVDGTDLADKRGALILTHDAVSLVVGVAGDEWPDPEPFQLWISVDGGSASAKIAFTRWSIGIQEGDKFVPLWSRSEA